MGKESITSGIYLKYDSLELSDKEINSLKFFLNKGRAFYLAAAMTSIPILTLALKHSHNSLVFNILCGTWVLFVTIAVVKTIPLLIMATIDIFRSLRKTGREQYIRRSVALVATVFGFDRFYERTGAKPNSEKIMPDYLFHPQITEEEKKSIVRYIEEKLDYYLSECSLSDAHILFHHLMITISSIEKVFIGKYSFREETRFFESMGESYKTSKDTLFRAARTLNSKNAPTWIDGNHNLIVISTEKKEIKLQVAKLLNIKDIK